MKTYFLRDKIAVAVGFELAAENLRVRRVADAEEHGAGRESPTLAGLQVAQAEAVTSFLLTSSTSSTTVSVRNSIFGFAWARSSMIFEARNSLAAMDERDLVGEAGQEEWLLPWPSRRRR